MPNKTIPFTDAQYSKFEEVDNYICSYLLQQDDALESTLKTNRGSSLDTIDVAPNQGKMLYLLAKMNKCKRILEIGTLGGYSAIWFAKALPSDGKLITLELDPKHASIAESNIKNAGFENVVEVRVGPALESLDKMAKESPEPFDMVFIDADKENNVGYLKWALEFSHVGTLIVVDNIVRQGRLVDLENKDPSITGVREVLDLMKREKRLEFTGVQTVGSKGWDGFAMGLVIG